MKPDVERLERSVVAAVAPSRVIEVAGWLVPLDDGPIGRAKSAVPLSHEVAPQTVGRVVEAFRDHGLPPSLRLAELPELAAVAEAAGRHGLTPRQPTVMKIGDVRRMAQVSDAPARFLPQPDAAWTAVFMGEGFDPEDGRRRLQNLARAPGALYGAAGATAPEAVGVATVSHGLAGVHGMRTAPAHRGKGHAAAILGAFGRALAAQGIAQAVLQVEEPNRARRIYRRAGFEPLWIYRYWR